jgi:hypothetical protein
MTLLLGAGPVNRCAGAAPGGGARAAGALGDEGGAAAAMHRDGRDETAAAGRVWRYGFVRTRPI